MANFELRMQSDSCNYSCSSWRGYRTNEMNFRVSLTLNDSILAKGWIVGVWKEHKRVQHACNLASHEFCEWWWYVL